MNKRLILAGVSAAALLMGVSGASWAQDRTQGADASVGAEGQTVIGNTAGDFGSLRTNAITDSYNGAAGVHHIQQNNGSNNALYVASAVQSNIQNVPLNVAAGAFAFMNTLNNDTTHIGGTRSNEILDSFNDFSGVLSAQQNNGDHNEMGIATAVHASVGGPHNTSQQALAIGQTSNQTTDDGALTDIDSTRTNLIDPSFTDAEGVISVQQNNGNANAMAIASAVVANTGSGTVVQSAQTQGSVIDQDTVDSGLDRDNRIDSSFNGAQGVVSVQQNNGDANVMNVANAVSANIGGGLGDPLNNDVQQGASTLGTVGGSTAFDDDSDFPNGQRENTIANSFNGAGGLTSVQQNNGSNNVMGIANSLQANLNTGPSSLNGDDNVTQVSTTTGGTIENIASQVATPLTPNPSHRQNAIDGSFGDYQGVATAQQNNGDNNVMGVANTVVANVGSGDKTDNLSSTTAVNGSTTNAAFDGLIGTNLDGANRDNIITGSFEDADGVLTVQQNNGNNNVMGAANAVVANLDNASDPSAGSTFNSATGFASVTNNVAIDHQNTDRVNSISGSFNNAFGVWAIQQNNGDNNVMGASTSVAADNNQPGAAGFGPAASVAALGAIVSGNITIVSPTNVPPGYSNSISGSFGGSAGVGTVQQNNGSNNAIQSAISVTANF